MISRRCGLLFAAVWVAAATTACGTGDDSASQTFTGSLSADAVGKSGRHAFTAKRDGALTIRMVELRCGSDTDPEISVYAAMGGVNYLSGYLRAGQSISQPNGSAGTYDVEVSLGRIRYAECQYSVNVSQ